MTEETAIAPPPHAPRATSALLGCGQTLGLTLVPERTPVPRARAQSAITLAVTSGKGGVGKTTITANLGVVFARMGRRVLVVDADLGLAGLDIALGVSPRFDLGDVVDGRATVSDALVAGAAGVVLLPAARGRAELASIGPAARGALLRAIGALTSQFDVVLLDTGAGIGPAVLDFATHADDVLLVVTPDPVSLRDAYAMTKALVRRAGCMRLHVLANQLGSASEGPRVHDRLEALTDRFLEVELRYAGGLCRDPRIAECTAHGIPFVRGEPASPQDRVLVELARALDPVLGPSASRPQSHTGGTPC